MKKITTLLCILAIAFLMASCSSSPSSVAKKSIACLQDKDYKGYAELLYYGNNNSEEELEEAQRQMANLIDQKADKQFDAMGGIKSCEVTSEQIDEDGKTAKVTMNLTYGNGKTEEETFKLRKDSNDDWRIDFGK